MQIEKCKHKIKCDFLGCKNMADYSLRTKSIFKTETFFCEQCIRGIYEEYSKIIVPKSVTPPFKTPKTIRRVK